MNEKSEEISSKNKLENKSLFTLNNLQVNLGEILELDNFPDILNNQSYDQAKLTFEILYKTNNFSLINKHGSKGGFTALHWMCIKNEYDLIEYLIEKFNVDVNTKADMGETPLLICIRSELK
jgi:ankyrin repeat protein